MADIFREHVFPKYSSEDVIKAQMNGLDDLTLKSFSLLNISALLKDECKEDEFEKEFILSFLNAAKVLASGGRKSIDKTGMIVFYEHSYALPVLFLTRHCMELAIKRTIRRFGAEPKKIHGLQSLWDSLVSKFPNQKDKKDKRTVADMHKFVQTISNVDDNGVSLRYPKDRNGSFTQDKALFVNNEKVVSYLEKFVEQLDCIDFKGLKLAK